MSSNKIHQGNSPGLKSQLQCQGALVMSSWLSCDA